MLHIFFTLLDITLIWLILRHATRMLALMPLHTRVTLLLMRVIDYFR